MFQTNNPAFKKDVFAPSQTWDALMGRGVNTAGVEAQPRVMTVQGTVNASFILLMICFASAMGSWAWLSPQIQAGQVSPYAMALLTGGGVLGLLFCLALNFFPKASPFVAPVYAVAQGAFVGAVSLVYETRYGGSGALSGIVIQAVVATFGVFFAMLALYSLRIIRATNKFKAVVTTAGLGILFVVLASWVLRFVNVEIPYIWGNGPIGLGVAIFITVVAALFLILDFDFIENGAANGAPKYYEWYGAFGLLATLVWLYLSILRLLAILRRE